MNHYTDRKFLVTGGTGSFGKAVVKFLLGQDVAEIRILSRDEAKQDQMRSDFADNRIKYHVGDVRDYQSVSYAMEGISNVFHAAALKQVPSCEFFPMQAVMTNISGSDNVLRSAVAHGVSKVVCLSTDKAVYPINAMGLSKAMMEKLVQACARQYGDRTVVSCVRYGNVMYSRGSVIPRFIQQIIENKPLTVTNPRMTRFLMSLDESVMLVDHAFTHSMPGDIFIQKAPACTVETLARALLNLFAAGNEVIEIGTRHGEKLYETLANKEELLVSEENEQYFRLIMDDRDLNYDKYFVEGNIDEKDIEDYHSHNTRRLDVAEVEAVLLKLSEVQDALHQAGVNP